MLGNDFRSVTIKSTKAFANAVEGTDNVIVKEADEKRKVVEAPDGYRDGVLDEATTELIG